MLVSFVSVQAIAQAVGAASGILLVRALSAREYALFTIASSMQGTMNLLADTGLSIGLTSIGGRVWQDPHRFGELITTAMRLRRALAAVTACAVTPLLVWMLRSNGSSYAHTCALTIAVLSGLTFQLTIGVFVVVPRLLSQIRRVQILDLSSAVVRFVILIAAYFIFLNAAVAIFATVVTLGLQSLLLKRWAAQGIHMRAPANLDDRAAMLQIVRNQLPTAIFYCIQGQLLVWILSVSGSVKNVADIGALGRISILFSIVSSIMTSIIVPRFARTHSRALLSRRFVQITLAFVLFGAVLVGLSAAFPEALLWILGSKYKNLREEIFLMMTMTALSSVASAMWSLNSAKAWIQYSWVHIPSTVLTQCVLIAFLDVSTLRGALYLGILSLLPTTVLNVVLAWRGLQQVSEP